VSTKISATGGRVYKEMLSYDGYARGNQENMTEELRIRPNVGS